MSDVSDTAQPSPSPQTSPELEGRMLVDSPASQPQPRLHQDPHDGSIDLPDPPSPKRTQPSPSERSGHSVPTPHATLNSSPHRKISPGRLVSVVAPLGSPELSVGAHNFPRPPTSWRHSMPRSKPTPIVEAEQPQPKDEGPDSDQSKDLSFQFDDAEFEREVERHGIDMAAMVAKQEAGTAPGRHRASSVASTPKLDSPPGLGQDGNPGTFYPNKLESIVELEAGEEQPTCVICKQTDRLCVVHPCMHKICPHEVDHMLKGIRLYNPTCPACHVPVTAISQCDTPVVKFPVARARNYHVPAVASPPVLEDDATLPWHSSDLPSRRLGPMQAYVPPPKQAANSATSSPPRLSQRSFSPLGSPTTSPTSSFGNPMPIPKSKLPGDTNGWAAMPKEIAVIRIDSLPTTRATLAASLAAYLTDLDGIDSTNVLAPTLQPIRLLCDATTGRTLPVAFVECSSLSAAQAIIHGKHGRGVIIPGGRKIHHLNITMSSQDEMLNHLFPAYKLGFSRQMPLVPPGLDVLPHIILPEEIRSLLHHANIARPRPSALQPYERPFLFLASIVEKYPYKADMSKNELLMSAMKVAMHLFTENKHEIHHWQFVAHCMLKATLVYCPADWSLKEAVFAASGLPEMVQALIAEQCAVSFVARPGSLVEDCLQISVGANKLVPAPAPAPLPTPASTKAAEEKPATRSPLQPAPSNVQRNANSNATRKPSKPARRVNHAPSNSISHAKLISAELNVPEELVHQIASRLSRQRK